MAKIDEELIKELKHRLVLAEQSLSEHLSAINENTSELQSLFDYLQEIDQKIEKLAQRIDQIQLQTNIPQEKPFVAPLNQTEKKIFVVLYTEERPLNCLDLSQKSGVPSSILRDHLALMAQKGIPLDRIFKDTQTYYKLNAKFKEWQAKENILNLSLDSFIQPEVQTKLKTYPSDN